MITWLILKNIMRWKSIEEKKDALISLLFFVEDQTEKKNFFRLLILKDISIEGQTNWKLSKSETIIFICFSL